VRRVLPSLFPPPPTTKRRKQSNPPKLNTIQSKTIIQPQERSEQRIPTPREKDFVCMFCGRACHLDEFCFCHKRIEKICFEYARNTYRDQFINFPSHSYSRVSPRSYSRASLRTSSRALPQFSHGPNHRSYGFGSRENRFVPRRFGYGPRSHRGDRFSRRSGFPARGSHTHFELRHLAGPHFPHRGSRPTRPNGEVHKTLKASSGRMVKCWIPRIYLTDPSTEPSTFSRYM
jgi:hypothetical protein